MEGRSTDRKSLDNYCETVLVEPGQEARCGFVVSLSISTLGETYHLNGAGDS